MTTKARFDVLPFKGHDDCQYFVLDLTHDRAARSALTAYATLVQVEKPDQALEIRAMLRELARQT